MSFLAQLLLLYAANALIFSFVEWWVHRTVMHRRSLPAFLYRRLPYFEATYAHHAILHHQTYYQAYDDEPDPQGRELNIRFVLSDLLSSNLFLLPLHAAYWLWLPVGSAALFLMLLSYWFLWNALHAEMHMPSNHWAYKNPIFRFLNQHHYLHHMHPGRNFNVVFPLVDYLFRTVQRPSAEERRDMEAYGLFGDLRGPAVRRQRGVVAPLRRGARERAAA